VKKNVSVFFVHMYVHVCSGFVHAHICKGGWPSHSVFHSFFSSVTPRLKPEIMKSMSCFPFLRNKNENKVNVLKC
jgi:hypothetical protein